MAPKRFQTRLFLALAAVLLVMLLGFTALSRLALHQGLGEYVADIEIDRLEWLGNRLLQRYGEEGSWDFLQGEEAWRDLVRWEDMQRRQLGRPPPDFLAHREESPPPRSTRAGPPFSMAPPESIERRLALLNAEGEWIAGAPIDVHAAVRRPLQWQGRTVAQLALTPTTGLRREADRAFAARQLWFLLGTGLLGLAVALVATWLLGRRWLQPVADLTASSQRMARGDLSARVPVAGEGELAQLGHAFNAMASALERIETTRQNWLSDVAHELRTPLTALQGEVEALEDGVRPFSPATTERLARQVQRLTRLVDDLRLSLGQEALPKPFEKLNPIAVLHEAAQEMEEAFAQAGIVLTYQDLKPCWEAASEPVIWAETGRLLQVFHNLLTNSLRYTDRGGRVELSATLLTRAGAPCVRIVFADSAPGVAPAEQARLFDRFYRGDVSRSRAHGGSGLGLAICKTIVQAMQGEITASASTLGGLQVDIVFPLIASATGSSSSHTSAAHASEGLR